MRNGSQGWRGWMTGLLALLTAFSAALRADHPPTLRFFAPRLVLWADRTQAVPFALDATYTEQVQPEAQTSDPAIVAIVRAPEAQPGAVGFLRVRGLRPGQARLRVGEAEIPVEVRVGSPGVDASGKPKLVGLGAGSCLWGRVAVGVEWLDDGSMPADPAVSLRLAEGRILQSQAVTERDAGPVRRALFELDAANLPAGPLRCVPVVGSVEGEAVQFLVLHPGPDRIRSGECEDTAGARRPARFKSAKQTSVVSDSTASGLKAVANYSPDPVWTLPLEVAADGYYQLALVVRGTSAGGALPSLGLYLDEDTTVAATTRLVHGGWHRLIVGRPLLLEAGARLLSVRFENDFFAGKGSDRNLWLDRYELVRVVAGRAQTPAVSTPGPKGEKEETNSSAPEPSPAPLEPDERAAGEFIAREEAALAELRGGLQVAILSPDMSRPVEVDEALRVEGWLRGEGATDSSRSVLRVNGRDLGHSTGQRPRFSLSASELEAGENRLELVVVHDGQVLARSASVLIWRAHALRRTSPRLRISYPAPGQVLTSAEGVSARVGGVPGLLATAELLVDGEPFGPRMSEPDPAHPLFFPLPIHSLSPGEHTLVVRVVPSSQAKIEHPVQSEPRTILVRPAEPGGEPTKFQRAIRLLDRFAYGAEPRELARLLDQGEEAWLAQRLAEPFDPSRSTAWQAALSLFPPKRQDDGATVPRALLAMLLEPNPVRLRFSLWAENHFSTWIQKTGGRAKWTEHRLFSALGVAPFPDLLLASATSPAMLHYLDQPKSFAGRVNENYARELFELHTVGVRGGYTQEDVTRLASLLTGWMTADEALSDPARGPLLERTFRFDPGLNDGGSQQVFGLRYDAAGPEERFDRVRFVLEVLAAHPATARFICRKLAAHYVSVDPPEALVEALATVYLSTGGDLAAVLREIPRRAEFWQAPPRMTTPLDYALRLARVSGSLQPGPLSDFLRKSGAGLFDRPSPDGYPESDVAYADSQALSQRWRFAQSFTLPQLERGDDTPVAPRDPAVRRAEYAAILQLAAVRLTGHPLAGPSLLAAQELFAPMPNRTRAQLVREAAQIIAQLPEVQLR